jgi:hypothetical protein
MAAKQTFLIGHNYPLTGSFQGNGTYASSTLTSDATLPADGTTLSIGQVTYQLKTVPTQANDIFIGGTAAATLVSIGKAINGTGVVGTDYYAGTTPSQQVEAGTATATTLPITAQVPGIAPNSITTAIGGATPHLSWTGTNLTGGVDSTAFAVNPATIGSLGADGENEVFFHLIMDSTASTVTIQPEVLFDYDGNNDGIEDLGWSPIYEDSGIGTATTPPANQVAINRTFTGQVAYTFNFRTIADRARLKVKGTGTVLAAFITVGSNQAN